MAGTEQLPLPIKVGYKPTNAPFVFFKIAGRASAFIVDTGTPFTSVNRRCVESWGLADAIQPCDDKYYDGVVFADIIYDSDLCCPEPGDYTACCTIAKNFCFYIRECAHNLLGLDFLMGTRSDLNLDINKPTLCIYQLAKPVTRDFALMMDTSINGMNTVTVADTGFCDFLSITEEERKSLGLQTEELEETYPYES